MNNLLIIILPVILSFVIAYLFTKKILKYSVKNEIAKEINLAIKEGAKAFINKEQRVIIIFALFVFLILFFFVNKLTALSFILGAIFSTLAGYIGMQIATSANVRVAESLEKSYKEGLNLAFWLVA